jgi:phospholipid/cholesterol/gamma-HCH transport system permease protein
MQMARKKDTPTSAFPPTCELGFGGPLQDAALIRLSGDWKMGEHLPSAEEIQKRLSSKTQVKRVAFDTRKMAGWDSTLLTFLLKINAFCTQKDIATDKKGLPPGVQRLIALATAVPEKAGARKETSREFFLTRVGGWAFNYVQSSVELLTFIGESVAALTKFFVGKATFRRSDLTLTIQECGPQALGIVALISFLIGLILAFMGAVQLQMFGAQIYIANLVGLGMAREMGAIMTGIIMAGRTGAAFAAQLGTMTVNEEIDALKTMGISPMEFLVLPRMLALFIMMPLLCLYADLIGILGGAVVGIGMLDLTVSQYYHQTQAALNLTHFGVGIFKSAVFGILVALSGCLRGMQSGRSAAAVGVAATSAVVTAIVLIIVSDGLFAVITNVLGI